ncbi:MAG: phage major capsid protein [Nitrososphaerota archaeon]
MNKNPVIWTEKGEEIIGFTKAALLEKAEDALIEFVKAYTTADANLPMIPIKPEVVDVFKPPSVARKVFRIVNMPSEVVRFYIKSDVPSVGTGAEGAAAAETKITWGTPKDLQAQLLYGYARFSQAALEFTEGVIDLVAEHLKDLAWDLARKEDKNAFYGTGSGANVENVWTGLNATSGISSVDKAKTSLAVEDIDKAVAYFEELGVADNLVLVAHPRVLQKLRQSIISTTNAGLMAVSGEVFRTGEIISLLGLKAIVSAPHLPIRDYSLTDTTDVGDAFIFNPEYIIIGDRRKPTILRQPAPLGETADIAWDVKLTERAGFIVTRPAAVYRIQNCLAQ